MTLPKPTFRDFIWLAAVIALPLCSKAQVKKQDTVKCKVIVLGPMVNYQQSLIAKCGWVVRVYPSFGAIISADSLGIAKVIPYYYNNPYASHFLSYNKKDTLNAWEPFNYKLFNW